MAVSNVAIKNFQNGSTYLSWDSLDYSWTEPQLGYLSANYVVGIRFTTSAPITQINMLLRGTSKSGFGNVNYNFYYKICNSESELNACASYDHNTSGDGMITLNTSQYYQNNVSISKSLSAGTYYIALWRATANACAYIYWIDTVGSSNYYSSIDVVEAQGLVYIDNGAGFEAYQIFIDNGSTWEQYIPYIDNGSGWDICS